MAPLQDFADWGFLGLRLALGAIFISHGLSKHGMWKVAPSEQMSRGMLNTLRFLSVAEPVGALCVMFGLFTQIAAAGLALVMIGATYFKMFKWKTGFVAQNRLGWEFDLILFAASMALFLNGAGGISLDRLLFF